jgi:nucleotide sugar dehydrogenase
MPGYSDKAQQDLADLNYTVSYNPEFIAQGSILRDQASPDIVLIGEGNEDAGDLIEETYNRMTINDPSIHRMSRIEAEITKISLNCFLTTKIAFANMIGDILKSSNARPEVVLRAIGSDSRIGLKYLNYGFGYGGPCFPRDNRALSIYADDNNINARISKATNLCNAEHLKFQVEDYIKSHKKDNNRKIVFDTVTYKPGTTILEESQQLAFAVALAKEGYTVLVRESSDVINELRKTHGDLFQYEINN